MIKSEIIFNGLAISVEYFYYPKVNPAFKVDLWVGHPGSTAYIELADCYVNGVSIYEMLKPEILEMIEAQILSGI